MNCQRCNARIDYRFLTNCSECGLEVELGSFPQPASSPDLPAIGSSKKMVKWKHTILNAVQVFASSLVGLISGAVVTYIGAIVAFGILTKITGYHIGCGSGMFVVMLIISGAILGSVSGSAVAIKHPLCKGACR